MIFRFLFVIALIIFSLTMLFRLASVINSYHVHRRIKEKEYNVIKMAYKEFLNIYYIDKSKWYYPSSCDSFKYITVNYKYVYVVFNFIDFIRASRFMKKEEKRKKIEEFLKNERQATELFVSSVQQDIDKIRSEGQAKIAQADKLTKEVKESLINGRA